MARTKSLPDVEIYAHLLQVLTDSGEKSASFGVVSARCGLAPATLAQRFGSVDGMVSAGLAWEWARLADTVIAAEGDALNSSKGAQALLKLLPSPTPQLLAVSLRYEAGRQGAETWRGLVEQAIATRRGGGSKGRESAALIFAAWQGRQMWEAAGGKSFRLADMMKAMP